MDIIKELKTKDHKEKSSDFKVKINLSSFEASMIWHIRQHEYATFEIIKQNGEPRLIKKISSDLLKESDAYILVLEELKNKKAEETLNEKRKQNVNK